MKRVFMDWEFTGLHQRTTPISIGMVADTGQTFYAEFTDFDLEQCDDFVRMQVIPNLKWPISSFPPPGENEPWVWSKDGSLEMRGARFSVRRNLFSWFQHLLGGSVHWVNYPEDHTPKRVTQPRIDIWGDGLAYDWVLFCELFGGALSIPECVYYLPFDITTLFHDRGIDPDISRERFAGVTGTYSKHSALHDAQVIKTCYEKLHSRDVCKRYFPLL